MTVGEIGVYFNIVAVIVFQCGVVKLAVVDTFHSSWYRSDHMQELSSSLAVSFERGFKLIFNWFVLHWI